MSDPTNDAFWRFIAKRDTESYLEDPEPWFAPGAIEHLFSWIRPPTRVFEWGAGSSTLWFVKQACTVTSYETDSNWATMVAEQACGFANVCLVNEADTDYATPALDSYGVIVIDGRRRAACAMHAASAAPDGALVVFDDSHRTAYAQAFGALATLASAQWHFPGLSAMMTPKLTSIFYVGSHPAGTS